ncbi:transmembrane amino acid transporter protein-domain-containing protein [Microdochium trichocladiopsis]|uniref:Transmembrane amino acid transporter protein-domain-containing protein n=1 Tax=Microdochium trichocladiopsis TaxID=1682393 RepID=A0A9P9BKB4_9PEZI|nr:transmembrane amino acid transporter protein-domain-containing protein [Microdochium trichocladiopsis]KAH7018331.1 transmembrane amino acid transporter protein-domain-containing protein [Microdochium trichocladiopsis]
MEARASSPLPSDIDREREAQVISEHLPAGYSAEFDGGADDQDSGEASGSISGDAGSLESSLKLQGGDMHRDLFRAAARTRMHKRAATFHSPRLQPADAEDEGLTIADHMVPGGFRRAFIQQNRTDHLWASKIPVTRNFVEFLDLYGSFAGEDLADSDDEAIESDDEAQDEDDGRPSETRPLLGRRKSARAPRASTASTTKTFFTLLKAFIGTGIMFLPKAFNNGGILFSSLTMLTVAVVTMVAFHLLLECKAKYGGGYGEIGQAIAGSRMRSLILASVTLSQLGFVCAGIVFVAENMTSFLEAVYHTSESPLSATALVLCQLVVLIPLAFIRNIAKLGPAALLADVCILLGVSYIYYFDIAQIASHGIHKTVVLFNPDSYFLTIGSAIFTFEGIGLILPIQSSMAKPERFEPLLGTIMIIITVLYTSVGALCYATFGTHTSIEIIDNYPQTSKFVNAVQFLYSLAVLVGTPVQLFPALRIIEGKIFAASKSGKKSTRTKWTKNAFRTFLVCLCGAISIVGAGNLDRFVALIGSFACVPLVYIYPAYLHYKGVAQGRWARMGDVVFMAVGAVCMVFTTVITVVNSFF